MLRSAALRAYQLVEGMPGKERHVGIIIRRVRDGEFGAVFFNAEERNRLVEGAVGIKLDP